ncbi:Zeta toxin family protein [Kribbella flavida DSM 17836]|uniref:UDP-N-acetylglucosamine kinase n=1 Tax=Kribbella flavida (strain DSM 17836 / JCM 10339 / NBRC 14399) TaxID=479435 RepID=D2PSW5_KRIFD|nr:zeta toxin family protein [Kribbella flavida]ADB35017.1 Zeta toxin family protein [Kribbella flavida DSM 17836]
MADVPDGYALNDLESFRLFRDRIVPAELTGTPQQHPIAVVVAGQPGAGKAVVSAAARDVLSERGRPVVLSTAAYEPYHPRFHEVMQREAPADGRYLRPDGRRWLAQAVGHAVNRRYDVVLESELLDPSEFEEPARKFQEAGYQVEIAFIAVHEAVSRFTVLDRYLRALEIFGHSRMAGQAEHDAGYRGVLRAAAAADGETFADRVGVFRPDGTLIYGNQRTPDGGWQQPPRAVDAITWERGRPWSVVESRLFLGSVNAIERLGLSAPDQWIRDLTVEGARAVSALAHPRLDSAAITLHIATAGLSRPDASQ